VVAGFKGRNYKPINNKDAEKFGLTGTDNSAGTRKFKRPVPTQSGFRGGNKPMIGNRDKLDKNWDNCNFLQLPQDFFLFYYVPG